MQPMHVTVSDNKDDPQLRNRSSSVQVPLHPSLGMPSCVLGRCCSKPCEKFLSRGSTPKTFTTYHARNSPQIPDPMPVPPTPQNSQAPQPRILTASRHRARIGRPHLTPSPNFRPSSGSRSLQEWRVLESRGVLDVLYVLGAGLSARHSDRIKQSYNTRLRSVG